MFEINKMTIKNKMFFTTLGVILLFSTAIAVLARWILVSSLTSELELRGVAIAQSIAERGAGYVLDKDKPNLVSLVFDAAQLGERKVLIAYIFILDNDGNVLANTFVRPFPESLRQANPIPEGDPHSVKILDFDRGQAYDIAVPIKEGIYTLGAVHIGLNKVHIDNLVGKLRITFLGFISAIVVIIFFIAVKLSDYIIQPLVKLTRMSDEISRGNLDVSIDVAGKEGGLEAVHCPAYNNTDLPCWHFDQEMAGPGGEDDGNIRTCKECQFYRRHEGDEIVHLTDSFNNMLWSIKLYRRRLRESEQKYRSLFYGNPAPVFVLDSSDMRILDANPRALEVYGYAKDELIGKAISALEPEGSLRGVSHFKQDAGLMESVLYAKVRHLKKGRQPFFVNLHASRTYYREKPAVIFSAMDITEMVEKDAQLIQASKMKTLGEMSAGIAHELNQPLNAIKMGSDFLGMMVSRGREIPWEHLRKVAGEVSRQVDRAAEIINHLREFGRKSEYHKEQIDIDAPVRGVFTIIGQQLALQNIKILLELSPDLPPINAHSNRLEQVFFNMVANSRDAIIQKREANGSEDPGEISVRTWQEQERVCVSFSDSGCGISASGLQKIFEPFYTTKKAGQGMGLGLSISYGIIKDYAGEIEVGSEPGEGTTFKLSFPAV